MLAVGHAARLFVAASPDAPDGSVISIFLVVDRDLYEGHARSVGRDLRIADPVELEDVFLGDRTLLRLGKGRNRGGKTQRDDKNTASTRHGGSLGRNITLYESREELSTFAQSSASSCGSKFTRPTLLIASWRK